jgi:5'-deoxynucleotidase YfbR-like HD superfamily hydrolase
MRSGPFDFNDPLPSQFNIDDIAHGLSRIYRFLAQSRVDYNVADHAYRVSQRVAQIRSDPNLELLGLLHDASEAYMGDLPSPIKHHTDIGPVWKYHELRLQAAIERHFGLTMPLDRDIVKRADGELLATERRQLMDPCDRDWGLDYEPLSFTITPRSKNEAKAAFLARFQELTSARG